jgi:hypothetical protein
VSPFRLQLWREWREHRTVLLAILVLLPVCAGLLCLPIPRGQLGDPVFHASVSLGFALVGLVAIGGELLGSERRGSGARWLERLPSGLACAFRAKLVFFALTLVLTTTYGYGAGWLLGVLREAHNLKERQLDELLGLLAALVVTLGTWTFAASAWALRGGLSLLAAALVLAVLGFPVWRVIEAGYQPPMAEIGRLAGVLVAAALVAAWLGFVRGMRLARGPGFSTLLGLAPTLPVLLGIVVWSERKLAEREVFDPLAETFCTVSTRVTADGRFVFVIGSQDQRHWKRGSMPFYSLRIDLDQGSYEALGRTQGSTERFRECEDGLFELAEILLLRDGLEPLAFDAASGIARAFDPEQPYLSNWRARGLGIELYADRSARVVRDPFRDRDYPTALLDEMSYSGTLLVRPGRWLYSSSPVTWSWFDPDSCKRTPTEWPAYAEPLALLEDGRILLADTEGLRWIHPEQGTSRPIDSQGLTAAEVHRDLHCRRVPLFGRRDSDESTGTILLLTTKNAWLVLDEGSDVARLVSVADDLRFLRLLGAEAALVQTTKRARFERLDLRTGARTLLWPRAPAP